MTFEELQHILGRLEALLASEGGVLDRIYVCPHHPEAGFPGEVLALKIRCDCRKPGTSLLRRAGTELPIEPRRSAMIGDSLRDIGAARNFGIWAYGVRTGAGCRDSRRYHEETGVPPKPDLMFANVSDAVDFELSYDELCSPIVSAIQDAGKAAPVLVGICGRSRSGKSAVAHAVVRTLKERNVACLHVRLDDWIMPASERGANCPSEIRNRVDMMPDLIGALRSGKGAVAPGYDPKSRGAYEPVGYDASGQEVIVVDGIFACHRTIRSMLDIAVFVAIPPALQRSRFIEFYRWKGLAEDAIESLWRERVEEEWPAVDAQRDHASVVMALGEDNS